MLDSLVSYMIQIFTDDQVSLADVDHDLYLNCLEILGSSICIPTSFPNCWMPLVTYSKLIDSSIAIDQPLPDEITPLDIRTHIRDILINVGTATTKSAGLGKFPVEGHVLIVKCLFQLAAETFMSTQYVFYSSNIQISLQTRTSFNERMY